MKKKGRTQELDGSMNDFIERVRGAFVRQFDSSGDDYRWVTDVFEDYVIVRASDQHYRVGMQVSEDDITFDPEREWQKVRLSYVTELLERQQIHDVMAVWELKGDYPEVPIFDDVDYDALIEGDDRPVFVTLPIGKANVRSGNGRYYDDEFVRELERQVRAIKPIGLMGHLKPEDRATEFPPEAIHWVGAARVNELLWGKGYVPKGEARDRILRYKAQNKKLATSIDAFAEGVWDDDAKAYRMKAKTLKLNQIDIAPADRAGIADLAAVPIVTTEMADEQPEHEEQPMDKAQMIREMTAEDAALLPDAVRAAILAAAEPAPEVALVHELREALGAGEGDDIKAMVVELKQERDERRQEAVKARIAELVANEENGIKVEALRGLVTELVAARNPQTVEDAEAAYAAVVESEAVKAALAAHVRETMGPAQTTGVEGKAGRDKIFIYPEEETE